MPKQYIFTAAAVAAHRLLRHAARHRRGPRSRAAGDGSQPRRDHGGLIFIDLRDREGIVQLVFNPERDAASHEVGPGARASLSVAMRGKVVRRSEGTVNAELPTGEIEIAVSEAQILNRLAAAAVSDRRRGHAPRTSACKYRYLDLRRPAMQRNLRRRASGGAGDALVSRRQRLRRNRNADPVARPRPRARATTWCRAASIPASSTRCRNRRSSSSSS